MHHRRINHLRAQAHHRQSLALGILKCGDNPLRFRNLRRGRPKRFVDDSNLPRVNAAHAFKSHCTRSFAPSAKAVHVADIAVNGINRLHAGRVGGVDHARPRILRLAPFGGLHHAQIGRVILESDCQRCHIPARSRNRERVLDPQRRLQNRHDPHGPRDPFPFLYLVDHSIHFRHLLRLLNLRHQNQVRILAYDCRQIFESKRQLVDANHAFACAEVDRPQGVSNQDASRILFIPVHRIFQIEDHGIGNVQRGIDKILGLRARQIKPRAAQPFLW